MVGLEEHPVEEEPGANKGQGRVENEDVKVEEVDYYDPDETSSLVGSVHSGQSNLVKMSWLSLSTEYLSGQVKEA